MNELNLRFNIKGTKKMLYNLTSSRAKRGDRQIWRLRRRFTPRNDDVINHKAFTLAEVLITLLIIGVVASLVIPNLINDTRDAELNTALKKVYGELSQVTKQIIIDNGGTFLGLVSYNTDHNRMRNAYSEYLSVAKSCINSRNEGCWHPLSTNGGTWKYLDDSSTDGSTIGSGVVLNDGTLINFISLRMNCDLSSYYTKPAVCGWIIADINGFKMPNIVGKDVFYFFILRDRLEPWGSPDSLYKTCTPNINGGIYCTAFKLMQ